MYIKALARLTIAKRASRNSSTRTIGWALRLSHQTKAMRLAPAAGISKSAR